MSNRRRQYRVSASFDELVQIELIGPKVVARNVVLQDVSAGGAGVMLPASASGMLRMNDRIELRLSSAKLSVGPIQMFAFICHLDEREARPRVGLAFESWRTHRTLLDSDLRSLFNEREAFRVDPGSDAIVVELAALNNRIRMMGRFRDLSVLGFGLSMSPECVGRLNPQMPVQLKFTLPGDRRLIRAASNVCHARLDSTNSQTLVGIRLQEGLLVSHDDRKAITNYVMGRQRELLRMGVRTSDDPMRTARPDLHP